MDLGGIVCDYDRIFEIVKRKQSLFKPLDTYNNPLSDLSSRIQHSLGRMAVIADDAHSLGASRVFGENRLYCGAMADFTSFSFHAVKNFTTAEGGAAAWREISGIDSAEIYRMYQLLSLHVIVGFAGHIQPVVIEKIGGVEIFVLFDGFYCYSVFFGG